MYSDNRKYSFFKNVNEALEWITGPLRFGVRPGLRRIEFILESIGNPEQHLKFIHIAGTNGKGSTCAFLTRSLLTCGYNVGTFTSPYIEKYQNRVQFNGDDILQEFPCTESVFDLSVCISEGHGILRKSSHC